MFKQSETPITGNSFMIDTYDVPMASTILAQAGPLTYQHTTLTLTWSAPKDIGCRKITGYKYQIFNSITTLWNDATLTTMNGPLTGGMVSGLASGTLTKVRLVASNSLGYGTPSEPITLTPAVRPSAPGPVLATKFGSDWLDLTWISPTDTGANDATTVPLTYY